MKSLSKQNIADWGELTAKAEQMWDEVMAAHGDLVSAVAAFNAFIEERDAAGMVEAWAFDVELYAGERVLTPGRRASAARPTRNGTPR